MYMVTDNARAHIHVNAACADTYMIYHVRIIRELQLLCTLYIMTVNLHVQTVQQCTMYV